MVTPYKKQATLIEDLLGSKQAASNIYVNTVHSFQGSEKSIIIFDTTESPGSNDFSMLDERKKGKEAKQLLNVALTRARKKLFILANTEYLKQTLDKDANIVRIIDQFSSEATCYNALALFEMSSFSEQLDSSRISSVLYNEDTFWSYFENDLRAARREVFITSAFITKKRVEKLLPLFREVLSGGVTIDVYCRPPEYRRDRVHVQDPEACTMLETIGVKVRKVKDLHQKVVIIDQSVAWNGSLNILSQSESLEVMHRIYDKALIKELSGVITRLDAVAVNRK